jgi:hypothetical protein
MTSNGTRATFFALLALVAALAGHSETAAAGREACREERAITNVPEAVYFFAGCRVGQNPARVLYRGGTHGAAAQVSQLAARLQGGTALLVRFSRNRRPFLLSPAELRQ